jgi:hypothetical protein
MELPWKLQAQIYLYDPTTEHPQFTLAFRYFEVPDICRQILILVEKFYIGQTY